MFSLDIPFYRTRPAFSFDEPQFSSDEPQLQVIRTTDAPELLEHARIREAEGSLDLRYSGSLVWAALGP